MGDVFIDSGWKYKGTDQADSGITVGPLSMNTSTGFLYLLSDFNENVNFSFNSIGAGVGASLSPIDITATTKELPSVGVVLANPAFRESLSLDDFTGPCLIQSYSASAGIVGASSSLIFFAVGKGIMATIAATILSGGVLALGAYPAIISSCSALVACAGSIVGSVQVGASVLLGNIELHGGRRGSSDLCGFPWRVTTNGKEYSYIFHEDGRCYWYEYQNFQISPDGKGKWRVINNHIEISWESGSKEKWNLPVSFTAQTGTWQTKETKVFNVNAKFDLAKLTLIQRTLNS